MLDLNDYGPKMNKGYRFILVVIDNFSYFGWTDNLWSIDLLDLNDYGPKMNKGYRFILVVIDNFSYFGWTVQSKNKIAQTVSDSFENILNSSKKTKIK